MENKKLNPKLLSMFGMGGAAFGFMLPKLARNNQSLTVVSADMSSPAGLDKFKSLYPDRFLNVGIAEQNMIGVAAGLTNEGYRCICEAQACFVSMRDFEQVRQFCGYMGYPLILVGIGGGFSLAYMGNTHYALEDISLMRSIPGMTVIAPCDSLEAAKAIEAAVNHDGPVYIRLQGGAGWPAVHKSDFDFKIGKAVRLREGRDIQLIACGSMVCNALKAADILDENGISAEVVDMHTVKPLDTDSIKLHCPVFTIEEHRPVGGLGDTVASYIAQSDAPSKLVKICVDEVFPSVGDYEYMIEECGLSPAGIAERILSNLK